MAVCHHRRGRLHRNGGLCHLVRGRLHLNGGLCRHRRGRLHLRGGLCHLVRGRLRRNPLSNSNSPQPRVSAHVDFLSASSPNLAHDTGHETSH